MCYAKHVINVITTNTTGEPETPGKYTCDPCGEYGCRTSASDDLLVPSFNPWVSEEDGSSEYAKFRAETCDLDHDNPVATDTTECAGDDDVGGHIRCCADVTVDADDDDAETYQKSCVELGWTFSDDPLFAPPGGGKAVNGVVCGASEIQECKGECREGYSWKDADAVCAGTQVVAGTVPAIIQLPIKPPTAKRIKMGPRPTLMPATMLSCTSAQVRPRYIPTRPAAADAIKSATWLGP